MEDQEVKREITGIKLILLCILISSFSIISFGCAAVVERMDRTAYKIKDIQEKFVRSIREPGEKMITSPEKTSGNYSCPPGRTTFILEQAEVIPSTISRGDEINQRIRYAMCSYTPSATLRGKITRSVSHNGVKMFQDVTDYEFKPGTWTVDAFIQVPDDAKSGVYLLESVLHNSQKTIKRTNEFVVKR